MLVIHNFKITSLDRALYGGLGVLLVLTVCAVAGMSKVRATETAPEYSHSSTAAVHVSATCSMQATVDTAHTATLVNGIYSVDTTDYANGIGKTTIKTLCNDPSGYALYAVGFTGDTMTGANHTKLVGQATNETISTGTYTSGVTTDSVWSMKLSNVTDGTSYGNMNLTVESPYTNYAAVPASFTKVASYSTTTDKTLGSKVETTYAAYVGGTQAADTYVGKVKYVLVHPNSYVAGNYDVTYIANGGTGSMQGDTNVANYEPYTLKANGFTAPAGTIFGGWCTSGADQFSCTDGMSYAPGEVVTSLQTAGQTATLYAYWTVQSPMQTFSCASLQNVGDKTYLRDSRDNNVYLVGKLADGKCWMLDNLRLDPTASGVVLTANNTNAPEAALANYKNNNSTGTPGWSSTAVANVTSGFTSYTAPMINNSYKDNVTTHYGAGSGKVGVYYNYCAATAGTYCYASGAGVDVADTLTDAPYDICPASWRMPTGGVRKNDTEQVDSGIVGEYQTLCTALNGGTPCTNGMGMTATNAGSLQYNLGLPLSGSFYDSTQNGLTSNGYWWSSTRGAGNRMYNLSVLSGSVYPMNSDYRYYGFSMRCVASQ